MKKNSRTNVVTLLPKELAVAVSFRIWEIESLLRSFVLRDLRTRYVQKLIYLKGVRSELYQDKIPNNFDYPCDIV